MSIPIRNEFGQIGTEFRLWPYLQEAAERERVMLKASLEPDTLYPRPGMLTREHLERLAEKVRGDVTMVVKFSPSDASDLTRRVHDRYEERYSRKRKATA